MTQNNGTRDKLIVSVVFPRDSASESGVSFSPKEYSYFTDLGLEPEDWVIVVVSGIPKTVKVVQSTGLSLEQIMKANKWIVQKVDLTEYANHMARETLITEIENQLDAAAKKFNRYQVFKTMAQESPQINALLTQLQNLDASRVPQLPETANLNPEVTE